MRELKEMRAVKNPPIDTCYWANPKTSAPHADALTIEPQALWYILVEYIAQICIIAITFLYILKDLYRRTISPHFRLQR